MSTHAAAPTASESESFALFAATAQSIGATTKRLEKAAILGAYFANLGDDALLLAARYFGGTLFPLNDGRTVNIGAAALLAAITTVSRREESHLRSRIVVLGDPGDLAQEALEEALESARAAKVTNATSESATSESATSESATSQSATSESATSQSATSESARLKARD